MHQIVIWFWLLVLPWNINYISQRNISDKIKRNINQFLAWMRHILQLYNKTKQNLDWKGHQHKASWTEGIMSLRILRFTEWVTLIWESLGLSLNCCKFYWARTFPRPDKYLSNFVWALPLEPKHLVPERKNFENFCQKQFFSTM